MHADIQIGTMLKNTRAIRRPGLLQKLTAVGARILQRSNDHVVGLESDVRDLLFIHVSDEFAKTDVATGAISRIENLE